MIYTFFTTAEYSNRGRSNRQFMADLYEVYFRRAPDAGDFNYWTNQLDTGVMTRIDVMNAFFGTPEWQSRINAIAAAGCVQ